MLKKSEIVLERGKISIFGQGFVFRSEDSLVNLEVFLPQQTWQDMGSPDTITATVEPGDKLNSP